MCDHLLDALPVRRKVHEEVAAVVVHDHQRELVRQVRRLMRLLLAPPGARAQRGLAGEDVLNCAWLGRISHNEMR